MCRNRRNRHCRRRSERSYRHLGQSSCSPWPAGRENTLPMKFRPDVGRRKARGVYRTIGRSRPLVFRPYGATEIADGGMNDMREKPVETAIVKPNDRINQVLIHQRVACSFIATFAMDLIKAGSFLPTVPDGDDSAGNRVYTVMSPADLVARSVVIAELTFGAFAEKSWVVESPSVDKLRDDSQETAGFHR
jgi:hypothetical protein